MVHRFDRLRLLLWASEFVTAPGRRILNCAVSVHLVSGSVCLFAARFSNARYHTVQAESRLIAAFVFSFNT